MSRPMRCRRRDTRSARSRISWTSTDAGLRSQATSYTVTARSGPSPRRSGRTAGSRASPQRSSPAACSAERSRTCSCPPHGEPVWDPGATLERARVRIEELATMRLEDPWRLSDMQAHPWAAITPHLLRNRTSFANGYALLAESGDALLIDFGYEVSTGLGPATERSARRPLLWAIEELQRAHGVERVAVVIPTHYHDDHVAGLPLLRTAEGTEVWAPANVAPILADPHRYDLPCLWHEPIPVDRVLPLGRTFELAGVRVDAARTPGAHALRGGARIRGRREARPCDRGSADHRRPARRQADPQLPVPQSLPGR